MDFNGIQMVVGLIILFLSIAFHEYAHGWMANYLGDDTAEREGRLTLNPLAHVDLFGTIIVPVVLFLSNSTFLFGWAKPVPYDPRNFRNPRRDGALVALAGPMSNILLAIFGGILFRVMQNVGSLSDDAAQSLYTFCSLLVFTNLYLAVFNLLPIPPLDGSKLLAATLPETGRKMFEFLDRIGPLFAIVVLMVLISVISPFLFGITDAIFRVLIGV